MDRAPYDATSRGRAALAGIVAVALAVLASSSLGTVVDNPAAIGLAVAALALVALIRLGGHGAGLVACFGGSGPPAGPAVPRILSGRITDPTHHPLRPRAPGTV